MIELSQKILTINWLQNKLISHKNGVVFDNESYSCFNLLQDFVEANDHRFKTPVIYYQAFPQESAAEFIATLREEVTAKLGNPETYLNKSLLEIVTGVGLKMIIIDQCHLHPLDTLDSLLKQLQSCNVCLILVGAYQKMELSQVLNHHCVAGWEQIAVDDQCRFLTQVS